VGAATNPVAAFCQPKMDQFIIKGPVGFLAGRFSTLLRSQPMVTTWINRASGTVLIGLGLKPAFEQR